MRISISPAFSRAVLGSHSLLGVVFGALIFLICVSGTLAVLSDEFTIWETPEVPHVASASPEFLARVASDTYAAARKEGITHDMYLTAPTSELPRVTASALDHGRSHVWSVDGDGRFSERPLTPWTSFMQDVHFNLNMGIIGRYLVGIIGTLLLASLITGVLAHRRIIKDAFRLRWGGSKRLANADLHNRVGVWALPFHLIVSLTGSLLGLSGLIIMILAYVAFQGDTEKAIAALLGPQAVEDARPAPLADVRPMIAYVQARSPGAVVASLDYDDVGTKGQRVTVSVAAPGYLTRAEAWTFDGAGKFIWKAGYTDGSVGMRINGMLTPLHYGTYGGIWLKLIYVLLGTGLCTVIASGANIWLARRRDQGRAAPRLERLWNALVWVQPAAWAGCAIAALFGVPALPVYWGMTLIALVTSLRPTRAADVVRLLRLIGAASLGALAIAQIAVGGTASVVALMIDLALLLGALVLLFLAGVLPTRRRNVQPGEIAQTDRSIPVAGRSPANRRSSGKAAS